MSSIFAGGSVAVEKAAVSGQTTYQVSMKDTLK